ncbi:sugar phosphate isomerase/epimerase [Candidatus Bathyarchaeota archaeon]|nr:sugar phosphate isomerase/epimerase [Candidatus Bathyarchaeota archaeon]
MKLGISSLYLLGKDFKVLRNLIVSSNIRIWEIVDEDTHRLNRVRVRSLRRLKNDLDICFTVHAPFEDINIATLNEGNRRSALARMSESLKLASELEAEVWVIHPGMNSGLSWVYPNTQWQLTLDSLKIFSEKGEDSGLIVAVENMPSRAFILSSKDDFANLFFKREIGNIKMALDIGHANIMGGLNWFLKFLEDRIIEVHLHDNHGSFDEHNAIGHGTVNWARLIQTLVNKKFQGFMIIESIKGVVESYRRMAGMLRGYR